ncbi:MAG: hypothetical protein A2W22_05845 [Candidatus Levybacteria bacterium RBG_16_35_11]|nr:MAG: hypothetical protein A2W22_05845 [Candidatus Levybacteria bacterium RBG_16_35_11]
MHSRKEQKGTDVFGRTDSYQDPTFLTTYLDTVDSLLPIRESKQRLYNLLDPQAGELIIDLGCGIGTTVREMALRTNKSTRFFGIDNSQTMINKAEESTPEDLVSSGIISFLKQDANNLRFGDETFDAAYADRLFQHLANPKQVIREIVRVLKPGGRLIIADSCWEDLRIEGISEEASGVIRKTLLSIIENPLLAKFVWELMIQEGIKQESVTVEKIKLKFKGLKSSEAVLKIKEALKIGCDSGAISIEEMNMTLREIKNANPDDITTFLDFYLTRGEK